jgi:hypothetical protein
MNTGPGQIRRFPGVRWTHLVAAVFAIFVYKAVSTFVLAWHFIATVSIFLTVLIQSNFFTKWRIMNAADILMRVGLVFLATCFFRGVGLVAYLQIEFNSLHISENNVLHPWALSLGISAFCTLIILLVLRDRSTKTPTDNS